MASWHEVGDAAGRVAYLLQVGEETLYRTVDTSTYNIYCPESRLSHEPPMLNFWFSSCIRRQKSVVLKQFGNGDSCRSCEIGKAYFRHFLRGSAPEEILETCRAILMEANLVSAGSPSPG